MTNDLFDKAIALVFGEKTTIGQVCSFAKGLASNTVTAIPGFCCLDAPYQSKIEEWGEKVSLRDARMKKEDWYCDVPAKLTTWILSWKFSCQKYGRWSNGSEYVVQKSESDCNRLGPVTSGFNEAACDIFQGTWCPSPRGCGDLVDCVNSTTDGVRNNTSRQAFFTYMNGAPKIKSNEVR